MANDNLIPFLLRMANYLRMCSPARRAKMMRYVAKCLEGMADKLMTTEGIIKDPGKQPGTFTLADAKQVYETLVSDQIAEQAAVKTIMQEGVVIGHLIGTNRLNPEVQRELHICQSCGETIWTCPINRPSDRNPAVPTCTHCLEKRFPGITFPWSRK